jgi:CNT family concentrative nucleoside transporter
VSDVGLRAVSALGFAAMIGLAWLFSLDRRRFPWRVVAAGTALQLALGVLLLKTPVGGLFFEAMRLVVGAFIGYTDAGVRFVFGSLVDTGFSIFVNVLPIIVFSGCFFSVLYHLGVLQRLVDVLARVLSRLLRISGAESLAAVANLFVGMTEAALVVRPYLDRMTRSELFSLMTVGLATVAGSVLLAYVGMLGDGYAGHLATASLLSAPAGILLAKVMVPETGSPETALAGHSDVGRSAVNVIDAAAQGALAGLRLAGYVGALLVAFVAMIALANDVLGGLGAWLGMPGLTLQTLLGVKTVLNEFLAYQELALLVQRGELAERSAVIASYALCGFANFGSLAILLGGIGGLAPERRPEVASLGLRSILSGSLATFMTACVAGMLL